MGKMLQPKGVIAETMGTKREKEKERVRVQFSLQRELCTYLVKVRANDVVIFIISPLLLL